MILGAGRLHQSRMFLHTGGDERPIVVIGEFKESDAQRVVDTIFQFALDLANGAQRYAGKVLSQPRPLLSLC